MAGSARARRAGAERRFRRSPHLVAYWLSGQLRIDQHARGTRSAVSPTVVELLHAFDRWRTVTEACVRVPGLTSAQVARIVPALVERGLLVPEGAPAHPADTAAGEWRGWDPAAGFFHGSTRDVPYWSRARATEYLQAKAAKDPPPPAVTRSAGQGQAEIALPAPGDDPGPRDAMHALAGLLRARRTWRRFGRGALTIADAASLLGLTWGVHSWVEVAGIGRMPLKTAPSGGARHAIEAYVAVRRVGGVSPGLYHYDAAAHTLVALGRRLSAASLAQCFPEQSWMGRASLVVFMAAVFARAQWRYPFARAYRTVLAETGHHAQSFCLLATGLGLAPFCTMAFADTTVERALGLDGRRTAVLYAVGVGPRPAGVDWAPWPHTTRTPKREMTPLARA